MSGSTSERSSDPEPSILRRRTTVDGDSRLEPRRQASVHHYQPLLKKGNIRLLELQEGKSSGAIEGNLVVARLQNEDGTEPPAEYEALSYTWGDDSAVHEIRLGGWPVPIQANLWQFLDLRRRSGQTSPLWVDALCINQADAAERSNQVQMMGRIYQKAVRVLVWLGEAAADSDVVMNSFRSANFSNRPGSQRESTAVAALEAWTKRDYWARTWIIQEFLLAREICIWCGNQSVDWGHIERSIGRLERGREWNEFRESTAYSLFKQRLAGLARVPLVDLLENNQTSLCSDPRDKVYALISLASDFTAHHVLEVNYLHDPQIVFCEVMAFCQIPDTEICRFGLMLKRILEIDAVDHSRLRNFGLRPPSRGRFPETRGDHTSQVGRQLEMTGFVTARVLSVQPLEQREPLYEAMDRRTTIEGLFGPGLLFVPPRYQDIFDDVLPLLEKEPIRQLYVPSGM